MYEQYRFCVMVMVMVVAPRFRDRRGIDWLTNDVARINGADGWMVLRIGFRDFFCSFVCFRRFLLSSFFFSEVLFTRSGIRRRRRLWWWKSGLADASADERVKGTKEGSYERREGGRNEGMNSCCCCPD